MSEGRTPLLQLPLRADRSGSLDTGAVIIIVHCLEVEYPGPFSGMRGLGLNSVLEDKAFGALGGSGAKGQVFLVLPGNPPNTKQQPVKRLPAGPRTDFLG